MEDNPGNQKVIDLLSQLKNDQNAYPSELLELRRRKYLQQAVKASWAMGAGAGLKNTLRATRARLTPTAGPWMEAALVIAIVAEVSTAAYLYRHKLVDLFEPVVTEPKVQEVTSQPIHTSSLPVTEISGVPTATVTETPTVTFSPAPRVTGDDTSSNSDGNNDNDSSNDVGGGNNPAVSTPAPNENNENNGDNGNHFGQTKQPPKTTKEPEDTKVPKNK